MNFNFLKPKLILFQSINFYLGGDLESLRLDLASP